MLLFRLFASCFSAVDIYLKFTIFNGILIVLFKNKIYNNVVSVLKTLFGVDFAQIHTFATVHYHDY